MPSGVYFSANHTDITNHYIQMGVWGGLLLMFLFIGILRVGFTTVGKALRLKEELPTQDRFLIWTLGSCLFGHAVTFLSISYFDPSSIVFFYFTLAAIASFCGRTLAWESMEHASSHPTEETSAGTIPKYLRL